MKHLRLLSIVALILFITSSIISCKKDKSEPLPEVSGLSFINSSPDAPSVKFYLGEKKVNDEEFSFGEYLKYLNAYSGNRDVFAYEGSDKKISGKITLEKDKMYSVFLTGKWDEAKFVLLEDSLTKPKSGKAHIRFLNMSSDAPELDLGLTDGSTLVSNKDYKKNSGFIEIEGGTKYNFVIRDHATKLDTVSLDEITLKAGKIYTIWAKGFKAGNGDTAFGGSVIENH